MPVTHFLQLRDEAFPNVVLNAVTTNVLSPRFDDRVSLFPPFIELATRQRHNAARRLLRIRDDLCRASADDALVLTANHPQLHISRLHHPHDVLMR